jgi:hypothetical protein
LLAVRAIGTGPGAAVTVLEDLGFYVDDATLIAVERIHADLSHGKRAPYQYVVVLWAFAGARDGKPRTQPFSAVRDELAVDAVLGTLAGKTAALPSTADVRDRLAAIIDPLLIAVRTGDGAHAWRGALLAAADDGEAGEIFRAWFSENVKIPLRHILAEQALKGNVRRDWDIDLATELLFGPIWHRLIAMRGPVPEIYRTRLVDSLLRAIAPV